MLPYEQNEQANLLNKRYLYRNNEMFCGTKSYNTCWNSELTQPHYRFATRIVLSMIRYSKSAQKLAVRVCQVATVVMQTTQLVLSQFNVFNRRQ